ncbi:hypothetical protein V8C26DRAFT_389220 [Trichoderma gracile]
MIGFKSFFSDLMPKKDANYDVDDTKMTTAALAISEDGHQLKMSIDMAKVARMRCSVKDFSISNGKITINLHLTNPSPFKVHFDGRSDFILKQGDDTVGRLKGDFNILTGDYDCTLNGTINAGVTGVVTLKGYDCDDKRNTWHPYVVRLFEIDINVERGRRAKRLKVSES